jgi:hypothetical protein
MARGYLVVVDEPVAPNIPPSTAELGTDFCSHARYWDKISTW